MWTRGVKTHSQRYVAANENSIRKSQFRQLWEWFATARQNRKKRNFMKNITCWWIIPKITKLFLWFIKNIGYNQRGRERISYKCSFFLELREVSLELNFKGLKVVYYRRLQTVITFFSFFNSSWQFLKHDVSLHYFTKPILQLWIKCLQIRREAGWCLCPFLVAYIYVNLIFKKLLPNKKDILTKCRH